MQDSMLPEQPPLTPRYSIPPNEFNKRELFDGVNFDPFLAMRYVLMMMLIRGGRCSGALVGFCIYRSSYEGGEGVVRT